MSFFLFFPRFVWSTGRNKHCQQCIKHFPIKYNLSLCLWRMRDAEKPAWNSDNRGHLICPHTLPVVAKATFLPQYSAGEIRSEQLLSSSTSFTSLSASGTNSAPFPVSWGRWNLKWRFNEISGMVLQLDHADSPHKGWYPLFSTIRKAQSLINCWASGLEY